MGSDLAPQLARTGALPHDLCPLTDAEDALRLAQVEPERARALAGDLLEAAAKGGVVSEAVAVAERALGLAARELDDIPTAKRHLRRSVEIATALALAVRAAEARMSLSLVLAYAGDFEEALAEADLAAPVLRGGDAARLEMQRAFILQKLGRLDQALDGYRRALPVMKRFGDRKGEALLLMNRGVLHAYRRHFSLAEADLQAAARRFDQIGEVLYAAKTRHNIGFVMARRGDVAAALQWYDRAEADYRRLGVGPAVALLDRCETLLSVRLVPEARHAAETAAREFEANGMESDLAEAQLLLAQAAILAGEPSDSAQLAARARDLFRAQQRRGWAALASYAWLRSAWAAGDLSDATLQAARGAVDELLGTGWLGPAVDARLISARIALRLGRLDEAETELLRVSRARRSGPADLRARAWHAEALLRHARADRRGTESALRAGIRILSQHQATLGATELRVHSAARGQELATLGIQVALESGRGERVLAWSERFRAGALRSRPATPPADEEVAGLLAELRHVVSLLENAGFEAHDQARLLRRQAAIEAEIRRKTWCAEGESNASIDAPPSIGMLSECLGDAALVELVDFDGQLHAVTVAGGRAWLNHLGPIAAVEAEMDGLRFALARLTRGRPPISSLASDSFHHASRALDELLLVPLRARLADRAVVVVPTGALFGLPWSTLPSFRRRPLSVAPSAALWLRAASAHHPGRHGTVLVAGPGLPHGVDEVAELAQLYPEATTLQGRAATTTRVAEALNGSDLVHIVAHGTFRADNPLFSSLRLVDGPLTVYDLERLDRAPRRIVLSACDAGQSTVSQGDELMGLSSALFSLGTETLVASVLAVSDAITRPLMVAFHHALLRGLRPAEALATTQAAFTESGGESLAPTAGFLCFGAG